MTPFELDMRLQAPVFYMMRRGIRIDMEERAKLLEVYEQRWSTWQNYLDELTGHPVNVSAPKQMMKLYYEHYKLPVKRKNNKVTADEDALRSLCAYCEHQAATKKTEDARARWHQIYLSLMLTIKIRGVRKRIGSYINVDLDFDNRCRSLIAVGGTETMRFSHSKTLRNTGMNMATVPRELRQMFIADDDWELAEFDLNRGESWVYTFLSMDPELLRIHTSGGDFHSETASAIQSAFGASGMAVEEIARLAKIGDQFGYKIRFLGKKNNHANSYRMGPFRAAEVVNEESDDTNITVVPSQMGEAQRLWKRKYAGIEGWWAAIDAQLEKNRTLTTPYGRRRVFYGFLSDSLKKEATAQVPQSTSVDYLNRGMLRVYDELVIPKACSLQLLHQNHDSILVQYPKIHREEILPQIKECLEREPVIIRGHEVTIPVEGSYGNNWKELTTWKG